MNLKISKLLVPFKNKIISSKILMLVFIGGILSGSFVFSQEAGNFDKLLNLSFEELAKLEVSVVTGVSKMPETSLSAPMSVYVINREEMQRYAAFEHLDLLKHAPGISFYDTDYVSNYGPMIRGQFPYFKSIFAIELMPVIDPAYLLFTPNFFKQAEVARGPAGLTWGGSATAGVINYSIRDDLEGLELHAGAGNRNRKEGDILYGHKLENDEGNVFVGFHYDESDPVFITAENGKRWLSYGAYPSWQLISKIDLKKFKFISFRSMDYRYSWWVEQGVDWFPGYTTDYANRYPERDYVDNSMDTEAYRGEYKIIQDNPAFNLMAYGEYWRKEWFIQDLGDDNQRRYAGGFSGDSELMDGKLNLNFGGDLATRYTTADPASWIASAVGSTGSTSYGQGYPRYKDGRNAYIQGRYKITDSIEGLLGARWDYEKDAPDENLYSPKAGLFYYLSDKSVVKYIYNQAGRRPSGNELGVYGTGAYDPDPENMQGHDLIYIYTGEKFSIDTTLFYQELSDKIQQYYIVTSTVDQQQAYRNSGGNENKGLEFGIKYLPTDKILFYWNGIYQDLKVKESIINGVDYTESHFDNDRLPIVPGFSSALGVDYNLLDSLMIGMVLRSSMDIPYFDLNGDEKTTDAHFLDLSLRSKSFLDRYVAKFYISNLLDNDDGVPMYGEEYTNTPGTTLARPREYQFKLSANF